MTNLDATILGIVQGFTEFLPVSSSGHLTVMQHLLRYNPEEQLFFNLVVHLGTLLAVFIIYKDTLFQYITDSIQLVFPVSKNKASFVERFKASNSMKEITWVVIGTIPAAAIGLTYRKQIKAAASEIQIVAIMFILTGILLASTHFLKAKQERFAEASFWKILVIGIAQSIALLPGISRSGSTIAVALLIGLRRDEAARFSFLLAIPAILGGLLLEGLKVDYSSIVWGPFMIGLIVSGLTGYIALTLLIKLVDKGRFSFFAPYLWLLAAVLLFTKATITPKKEGHKTPNKQVQKVLPKAH